MVQGSRKVGSSGMEDEELTQGRKEKVCFNPLTWSRGEEKKNTNPKPQKETDFQNIGAFVWGFLGEGGIVWGF